MISVLKMCSLDGYGMVSGPVVGWGYFPSSIFAKENSTDDIND